MPSMETRTPRASIGLYAGRTLAFVPGDDTRFELRAEEDVVGRLRPIAPGEPGRAEAVEGEWWLVNPRGSEVDAGRDGSDMTIARYRPGLLGGGRIRIDGAGSYALRPPVLGDATRLRRGRRRLASISAIRAIKLGSPADDPALSLVLLVALQALLLEQLLPATGGVGAPGA